MKKLILSIIALVFLFQGADAQQFSVYETLKEHPEYLNGTDFLCPTGPVALTPAPKGYEAFYISHYGRHGARYGCQSDIYDKFNELFSKAAKQDNLTEVGNEFKRKFDVLYPQVRYRVGDLSSKGWMQQKELAERTFSNFPSVFKDGAKVTAYTSTSTRCVMTMSSFCLGLKGMNPKLDIFENFGNSFLPAVLPLSDHNPFLKKNYRISPILFDETWEQYIERKVDYEKILSRLFKNVDRAMPVEGRWDVVSYLYFLVNGMGCLDGSPDLTAVFTNQERVALWEIDNFLFYADAWPTHYGYMPIVEDIVKKADAMFAGGGCGADLRFAHDYTMLSLLMILGVDGMDHNCADGDEISYWFQTNRVPMGANIQLVFYRSKKNPQILFKLLFNGEEAHLPLKTDNWPYYTWDSFKKYYCDEILKNSDDTSVGPWVTNVTEDSASILWTSSNPGMGWVETADGNKIYDIFAGRRTFGKMHRVDIKGLAKGGTLKYRVGGEYLLDDSNARYPQFGDSWCGEWNEVRLFDADDDHTVFSVMNDIHLHTDVYSKLTSAIDIDSTDFIFLNGDIASAGNYDIDKLVKYEIKPLGEHSHSLPLFFARGNHEGRGNGIRNVAQVFPNAQSDAFYYTFRDGQAAFIVFDAGETGEDRSILYSGSEVYEDYIREQMEWAKKAMAQKEFADAPLKVCFIHVPMIDHPDKNEYKLQRWLNTNVLPLLNEAGIDIMIGADLHVNLECLPGTMGNNFPIIVNGTLNRLDFKAKDGKMSIRCYDADGNQVYGSEFKY